MCGALFSHRRGGAGEKTTRRKKDILAAFGTAEQNRGVQIRWRNDAGVIPLPPRWRAWDRTPCRYRPVFKAIQMSYILVDGKAQDQLSFLRD